MTADHSCKVRKRRKERRGVAGLWKWWTSISEGLQHRISQTRRVTDSPLPQARSAVPAAHASFLFPSRPPPTLFLFRYCCRLARSRYLYNNIFLPSLLSFRKLFPCCSLVIIYISPPLSNRERRVQAYNRYLPSPKPLVLTPLIEISASSGAHRWVYKLTPGPPL